MELKIDWQTTLGLTKKLITIIAEAIMNHDSDNIPNPVL